MNPGRGILYGVLVLLFVLHNDWWLWGDTRQVAGLPIGLAFHLAYTFATAAVMALLVRHAWPADLEVEVESGTGAKR